MVLTAYSASVGGRLPSSATYVCPLLLMVFKAPLLLRSCSTMSPAFKRLEVWNPARRGSAASGSPSSPTTALCGSLRRRFRRRSLRHSPPAAHLYIRKSSVLVITGSNTR
ncbi:uncharacterized protein LOC123427837 [Hordeum vulgare subsp. vulgare]|uniref:uncharacterized protein LOC123427837 n=1 Tax=Hordeum vulgare subsp. vulgare TaxID=112509 RepID=UPI001D1A3A7A|nr:uncharacterized protein LOC123427837 [Hordeum vulgare subsp. vulgare]